MLTPTPLPLLRILARAGRLAAHPVALGWIFAHVLGVWTGVVAVRAFLHLEPTLDLERYVWAIGWWLLISALSSTCGGGLAHIGWSVHEGELVTFVGCARAVAQRRGRVAREASITAILGLAGLLVFGVGFVWVHCLRSAVVPACVCERELSPAAAAERGRNMMRGNLVRGMALFALVTPVVIALPASVMPAITYLATVRALGYLLPLDLLELAGYFAGGLRYAAAMTGLSVYAVLSAATYVEQRSARPPDAVQVARVFE